ncbi:hypothetical protein [Butyrivibrio sp. MC2021]|uniref:hypothetical protein n=1 Tax=Butyrivibrio sp. MC2021 TaxID=1408306 RepID=UPI0004794291|nr:hypothetical protein [Butyrivibrio sp. MC2021]
MFYINTGNVRSAVVSFSSVEQTLRSLKGQVDDVSHNIADLSGIAEVLPTLEYISSRILEESNALGRLYDAGVRVVREYENAEENILDNQEGRGWTFGGGSSLHDFTGNGGESANSNKIDYGTLEELSGLFH